jgi:hypothetical protein
MKKTTFIEKWLAPLGKQDVPEIESVYQVRFSREYTVLFEHCLAYLNRLVDDPKYIPHLLKTEAKNLALLENDTLYLFLPEITPLEFERLHADSISAGIRLGIRDISKEYLKINNFYLSRKYRYKISSRSSEEVILSTYKISGLFGTEYVALRNTVNKIEKGLLMQYGLLEKNDYPKVQELLDRWFATQGKKYKVDRREIDQRYVEFFLRRVDENFISRKIHFNSALCGVALIEIVRPGFGVYIMNKCLNGVVIQGQTYGISGLSKYLYYKTCKELKERNISFLNVGSLGIEEGARKSKEELRPLDIRLESFQIEYEKPNL